MAGCVWDTSTTLPNDETPGTVDAGDYDVWKSHFGQSLAGSGRTGGDRRAGAGERWRCCSHCRVVLSVVKRRRRRVTSSRWTVPGAKAGRQTATYSAPLGLGRAVADPFARLADDGLTGANFEHAALVLDAEHAREHDGDFQELRPLPRLDPAAGRLHAGDAQLVVLRIDAADELFDQLRLVAGGGDAGRLFDESRHGEVPR